MNVVTGYEITRIAFPTSRIIGDSQVRFDRMALVVVELKSSGGIAGLGFGTAWAPEAELRRAFAHTTAPRLVGHAPMALLGEVKRPRGGNFLGDPFAEAVNQALWDLVGKEAGLPLWRLFGGTTPRTAVYASGLEFRLSDDEACAFFEKARARGFRAFKCKVGHEDVRVDIRRLLTFREIMGPDASMIIDANEAWSAKQAIRRLHSFRDSGLEFEWIEDPCLRDDIEGLQRISRETPFTLVCSGEYLEIPDRVRLLHSRAVDVLPLHGDFSGALFAARSAGLYGVPVTVGNTPFDVGIHLAAALPEVLWLEWSMLGWENIPAQPIAVEDGYAFAPDIPGHGISITAETLSDLHAP